MVWVGVVCVCRRSRRSQMMSSINKDGQFGFPEGEEEQDGTITYYQLETGSEDMFPPLPVCPVL